MMKEIPKVNLGRLLQLGLAQHVKRVLMAEDDSTCVLTLQPPKKPCDVVVIDPMLFQVLFDFNQQGGRDVMTADWASTLKVENTKGLNTPLELLEVMWLSEVLNTDGVKKAKYLGYQVGIHLGAMEEGCFCCIHNSKPKVYKYIKLEK